MRYKSLDFNLLVVLDALLEYENVSKAADKLCVGQPAVSAALARLRKHFGDPMFVLFDRKMKPTAFTRAISARVRAAVAEAKTIVRPASGFDPLTTTMCFTVMCSDLDGGFLIPILHRQLAQLAPSAQLKVLPLHMLQGDRVQEAFARFGVDVIVLKQEDVDAQYASEIILDAPLATLVSRRHGEPSFSVDEGDHQEVLLAGLSDSALLDLAPWTSEHVMALPRILFNSNLRVCLPDFVARRFCQLHSNLRMLNSTQTCGRMRQAMQWPSYRENEASQQWLREQVRMAAAHLLQGAKADLPSVSKLHRLSVPGVGA